MHQNTRAVLRNKRKNISTSKRYIYHKRICSYLLLAGILKHQHIALYLAFDGEVDATRVITLLQKYKKNLYTPILLGEKLRFVRIGNTYKKNKYGIKEPLYTTHAFTKRISLIITPLVGFDANCNRMGMGGGYYDKTLSFLNKRNAFLLPQRFGVAYSTQQTILRIMPWDVPLTKIITEKYIVSA